MAGAHWLGAFALGLAVALGAAGAAQAGTASVAIRGGSATLVYVAAAGERNNVSVGRDPGSGAFLVAEGGGNPAVVVTGQGCERSVDVGQAALCNLPQGLAHAARVDVGDGDDVVFFNSLDGLSVNVKGGMGSDTIYGPGNTSGPEKYWEDFTRGSAPESRLIPARYQGSAAPTTSTLSGGPGADRLEGGAGSDLLQPGPGQDWIQGSAGDDRVFARDGVMDLIKCDGGQNGAALDRVDFVWGECGEISSRKVTAAFPVGAYSYEPAGGDPSLAITIGCPTDGPSMCRGDVTIRGGPATVVRRFRVRRGHLKHATLFPNSRFAYRERSRITVRSRDAAGRRWAISRLFNLELPIVIPA